MDKFRYLNLNPVGIEEEDCVTRAIALASGRNYFEIREKLELTANLLDCEKFCVCCYEHLLDNVFKYKRVKTKGMTIEQFAKMHPKGRYLIRIEGHLTCLWNGCIYDLWDCRDRVATHAWMCD